MSTCLNELDLVCGQDRLCRFHRLEFVLTGGVPSRPNSSHLDLVLHCSDLLDTSTGASLVGLVEGTLRELELLVAILHGVLLEILSLAHQTRQVLHILLGIFVSREAHYQDIVVIGGGIVRVVLELNQGVRAEARVTLRALLVTRLQA